MMQSLPDTINEPCHHPRRLPAHYTGACHMLLAVDGNTAGKSVGVSRDTY
jgi:hypothetical protein